MIPAILWALVLAGSSVMACLWVALALEHPRAWWAWLAALVFGALATVAAWHVGVWISRLVGAVQ